jgi:SpoVK/Ycf46/Vps4 family AAA+-type ATPase
MPYDARLVELATALSADPQSRVLRLDYAAALLESGDSESALQQVKLVLASHPTDTQALGLGAMAAGLSGDLLAADAYSGALRKVQADTPVNDEDDLNRPETDVVIPLVSLADVAGNYEEKRRIDQVVLRPFRLRKELPAASPTGVLLFGPRHVGKADLAASIAGELHLNLVRIDMATVCDPWGLPSVGVIAEAFRVAAEHAPSMVFIDNLETVSHRRLRYVAGGRDRLAELESALDANDCTKVLVVAATDAPWQLHTSLRGRGRFDHYVLVGPPDREARIAAMERTVKSRSLNVSADIDRICSMAEGCTFADLRSLVSTASMFALAESQDKGQPCMLRDDHMRRALTEIDRAGTEWFDRAYNFPEFMDDSTAFDPLFDYIRRHVRR